MFLFSSARKVSCSMNSLQINVLNYVFSSTVNRSNVPRKLQCIQKDNMSGKEPA
jgi:hypothetical protein